MLILEAICDFRKYFWLVNFGDAGALNDINVHIKTSIVGGMVGGDFSIKTEPYLINGRHRDWMYFFGDGIYTEWSVFVTTFSNPIDQKKRMLTAAQERQRNFGTEVPCPGKSPEAMVPGASQ